MNLESDAGGVGGRSCGGGKAGTQKPSKGKKTVAKKKSMKPSSSGGKDGKKNGKGGSGEEQDGRKRKGEGDGLPSKKLKEKAKPKKVSITLMNLPDDKLDEDDWELSDMEGTVVEIPMGETLREEAEQLMVEGMEFAVSSSWEVMEEVDMDTPVEELGIPIDGSAVLYVVRVLEESKEKKEAQEAGKEAGEDGDSETRKDVEDGAEKPGEDLEKAEPETEEGPADKAVGLLEDGSLRAQPPRAARRMGSYEKDNFDVNQRSDDEERPKKLTPKEIGKRLDALVKKLEEELKALEEKGRNCTLDGVEELLVDLRTVFASTLTELERLCAPSDGAEGEPCGEAQVSANVA